MEQKNDLRKTRNGSQGLLNRWVFDLAWRLMEERCMARCEAFRQAFLAMHLLEELGRGEVTFSYWKSDDTLRSARGTLRSGISEAFDRYEYKTGQKDGYDQERLCFTYWDLDAEAFRSFAAFRLKEIVSVRIPQEN